MYSTFDKTHNICKTERHEKTTLQFSSDLHINSSLFIKNKRILLVTHVYFLCD